MTAPFREHVKCPNCGFLVCTETAFNAWVRAQADLDSVRFGLVRFDLDLLLHRYMVVVDGIGSRDVQALMFVEVKTHGAKLTDAQRDTLHIFNQVLRNRADNMYSPKHGPHALWHSPMALVHSLKTGRKVRLRMLGGHLLELSGSSPADSEAMKWHGHPIDRLILKRLLKLDLDPDSGPSWREMDWRRRFRSFRTADLWTPT